MKKKLVIFGDSAFAQIAYEYFNYDSDFEVVGFTVTKEYIKVERLFDLPVVPFEEIANIFPPNEHYIFIALVYNKLNRVRTKFYNESKKIGYKFANYVSTKSFVWRNVKIGDNVFIFENNVIQPFVEIGDNVILWSGNHIGHHSKVGNNCFFSSQVVLSGYCNVGEYSFLGVNATVSNNIEIGKNNLIGAGALITENTKDNSFFPGLKTKSINVSTLKYFSIKDEMD